MLTTLCVLMALGLVGRMAFFGLDIATIAAITTAAAAVGGATVSAVSASEQAEAAKKAAKKAAMPPAPEVDTSAEASQIVGAKLGNRRQRSLLAQLRGGTLATSPMGAQGGPATGGKKSLLGQ